MTEPPPTLQASGLERHVDDRGLFRAVAFTLHRGRSLVVRGPSGSGKTVLLRTLAGLEPLERGTLQLAGRPMHDVGPTAWRAAVAYVPQTPPVFEGTPAELSARIEGFAAQKAKGGSRPTALEVAADWHAKDAFERPWTELSGGERQRCHLAIAVALAPDVLLLDEPTSALDKHLVGHVEESLLAHTVVWVTHDDAQAERVAARGDVLELGA